MALDQEMRWAYSAMLPKPHRQQNKIQVIYPVINNIV